MPDAIPAVVINAGPLIALRSIDRLAWLPALYGRVVVPEEVFRELHRPPHEMPELSAAAWLERRSPRGPMVPEPLSALDTGETAVILLAIEDGIRHVLLDERKGRRVATALGLEVAGTVGLILRAKRTGLTDRARPLFEALKAGGLWLSDELIEHAARQAGE